MTQNQPVRPSIVIVGGGLAGLAAATSLAPRGFQVTLLESRNRLGGRASSFTDPQTGQLIDACQHVSMGCCTNLAHLLRTVGVEHLLEPQPKLYFMTPDRRVSQFAADPWPAPFHLGRALSGAHYLTASEKVRIGLGLLAMLLADPEADPPLEPWLRRHWQTDATIQRYWGIVLTSALNETVDRVGLKYARKVFVDGFMRHREGFVVEVPKVPLARLYGEEFRHWLNRYDAEIRENCRVTRLLWDAQEQLVCGVELRDGSRLHADAVIMAVPFERVVELLPESLASEPFFQPVQQLQPSPITSVHFWLDRRVMTLPHVVLVDSLGQWVFDRGEIAPGEYYLQVVVSAARMLKGQGRENIQQLIHEELCRLFPRMHDARVLRAKVVTEHAATFSAVPGIDLVRLPQRTPVPNLFLAGDWTLTGWPATMEGAVRSGYLAAEAVLARHGQPSHLVQPDLGA